MTPRPVDGGRTSRGDGQRRQITVLFCDLVGSTPLAGRLDPEDFRELLVRYHEVTQQAIDRYGGYTAQYLGDGVVACFGYPRAHEDDAQRAVYAGLAIVEGLEEASAGLSERFGTTLQVRIGCHTGLVVVGAMAGPAREEFSMVGETPHVAARLQGVAEPGSVVISDVTEALVMGHFETQPLGERSLAGVSRTVPVYRVLRPSGVEDRLSPTARARLTPLVNRAAELEILRAAWEGVQDGGGRVVRVSGEPGIGKTRLVYALAECRDGNLGSAQRWQCSRHHQNTTLYPVIRLLEARCRLERGEPETVQREKLRAAVLAAGLDPDDAVSLLVDLLPLSGERSGRQRPADAQEERTSLLRMLQALLVADPAQHPMLLVVEDLQWADPTTMELLWRILNDLPELPVLCVVTHRHDFSWPWRRQPGTPIELGPLAPEHVRELAGAVGGATTSEEEIARVCAAAGGVPLFAEEMMKVLASSPPVTAAVRAAAEHTVPATLHGLLTERLDRLSDVGEVLDVAAVLGREFDRPLLDALDPLAGDDLGPVLANLTNEDILRELDGLPVRYEFKHALLHDAAYSRVLRSRRQELHARVAATLVGRFSERTEREPELVAHHWSCAAAPAEAARYWHAAGTRALERAAFVEAAEHFRRGLEALEQVAPEADTEQRRADFLTHLGAALQAGHGYAAAGVDEAYASARTRWQATGDVERLSAVIRGQWMSHLVAADYDAAYELAWEMLVMGAQGADAAATAEGHLYTGMVHMYRGQLEPAREHLAQAITAARRPEGIAQVYEAQGDTVAGAHAYFASVLSDLGRERESQFHSERSLELAESIDRPVTRAQVWFMRAMFHLGRGEPLEFAQWVERVHSYSVDRNIRYWRTIASAYSNWVRGAAGDRAAGVERLQASIDSYRASGARLGLVHLHMLLADLLAPDAREAALKQIALAEEQMTRTGERVAEVELRRFKARVLVAGDEADSAAAIAELERGVAVAAGQGARLPELRVLGQLVRYRRRSGEDASADEHRLIRLCALFAEDSQLPDVTRARKILDPTATGA